MIDQSKFLKIDPDTIDLIESGEVEIRSNFLSNHDLLEIYDDMISVCPSGEKLDIYLYRENVLEREWFDQLAILVTESSHLDALMFTIYMNVYHPNDVSFETIDGEDFVIFYWS